MKVANVLSWVALSVALSAQAGTPLSDQELRTVQGKDGMTLMGDLNVKTEAFTYTDTDAEGGSISLNHITIRGMFVRRYDILRGLPPTSDGVTEANVAGSFVNAVATSMQPYLGETGPVLPSSQTAQQLHLAAASGIYTADSGDVVQIAFPNVGLSSSVTPTFTVQSITNGHSTASYGSLTVQNIDMQGTKRWLWSH